MKNNNLYSLYSTFGEARPVNSRKYDRGAIIIITVYVAPRRNCNVHFRDICWDSHIRALPHKYSRKSWKLSMIAIASRHTRRKKSSDVTSTENGILGIFGADISTENEEADNTLQALS